jgi:hypothetical protein
MLLDVLLSALLVSSNLQQYFLLPHHNESLRRSERRKKRADVEKFKLPQLIRKRLPWLVIRRFGLNWLFEEFLTP